MEYLRFTLFFLACLPPLQARQAASLSLKELVQQAIKSDQSITIAELEEQKTRLRWEQNETHRWPMLQWKSHTRLEWPAPIAGQSLFSDQHALTLTQPLFDMGVNTAQGLVLTTEQKLTSLEIKQKYEDLTLKVIENIYELPHSLLLTDMMHQQSLLMQRQFKALEASYKNGLKSSKEFLQMQGQKEQVESAESASQDNILVNSRKLEQSVRTQEPLQHRIETLKPRELTLPTFKPSILENHYLNQKARLQKERSQQEIEVLHAQKTPRIDLTAGANYSTSLFFPSRTPELRPWNTQIALEFTWDLWDWGLKAKELDYAFLQKRQVILQTSKDLEDLEGLFAQAQLNMEQAHRQYLRTQKLLKLQETIYNSVQHEYQMGKVLLVDMILATKDFFQTQIAHIDAFYALLKAIAQLQYRAGVLYDTVVG